MGNRILIVGTYDTKDDELRYIAGVITAQGGQALTMDVSVLGDPRQPTDWTKHDIAADKTCHRHFSAFNRQLAREEQQVSADHIGHVIGGGGCGFRQADAQRCKAAVDCVGHGRFPVC